MTLALDPIPVPLHVDESGTVRVSRTRVTLDTIITSLQIGETPERIVRGFPSVPLAAIYAVIAWYLRHHSEFDAHFQKRRRKALPGVRSGYLAPTTRPSARVYSPARRKWRPSRVHRLIADENLDEAIVDGTRLLLPDLDFVFAKDVGLLRTDDSLILAWAAANGCVLVTHDVNTMAGFAYDRIRSGLSMPGLVVIPRDLPIGRAVDELATFVACSHDDEWEGQVIFLSLRPPFPVRISLPSAPAPARGSASRCSA